MHQDVVGPGAGELIEIAFGLDDHQMHVEWFFGDTAHRFDDHRADRQVRDEAAIHYIDMDPIAAGRVSRAHLLAEPREIGPIGSTVRR